MKECMWKNNPTKYNLHAFYQQRRHVANIIKQAERSFYIEKLLENRTNFKEIFTITSKLLDRNDPSPLPPSEDPARLAHEFSDYSQDKINSIMLQLKPTSDCPIDNRYIEDGFLTKYAWISWGQKGGGPEAPYYITSQILWPQPYPFKTSYETSSRSHSNYHLNC